ncbi:MAG: FHA domain-containing protein [Myxococcales bacterium]|nr:FHA domain-containing protein [Myxococcales bacterium]
MVKLIIEDDEGKTTVVPLIRDEITIGRKEGNTIRLTERNVSRRHARLLKNNGTVFIEDTGSYNGIKVNGNRINGRVAVTEGDRIQIGDYVLGLKFEGTTKLGHGAPQPEDSARTTEMPRAAGEAAINEQTAHVKIEDAPSEAAPVPTVAAPVSAPARLVCVSTNFAGMEFSLRKSVMVLGRTDDNDIVINHRSISRHHCRIVEEHGRYTIIDLQSANGVRVNGEEYGKVELRRADHIDLGHVRLRFVAPGEDFVFERDATVVDISKGGGGKSGLWIGLAVVVLLALGVVIWRTMTAGDPNAGSGATGSGSTATPGTSSGTSSTAGSGDSAKLLATISSSLESESWQQAIDACGKLSGEAKSKAQADCDKASKEARWKKKFEEANSLVTKTQMVDALRAYNAIPKDSVYAGKRDSSPDYKKAREQYLGAQLAAIDEHVKKGQCEDARKKADAAKQLVPDDTQAEDKVKDCKSDVASADAGVGTGSGTAGGGVAVATKRPPRRNPRRNPGRRRPPRTKVRTKKAPVKPAVTLSPAELAAQLRAARTAYVNALYAKAISLARKIIRASPGNQEAWQVIGASACMTKKQALVRRAMRKLGTSARNLIRSVCQRAGISP